MGRCHGRRPAHRAAARLSELLLVVARSVTVGGLLNLFVVYVVWSSTYLAIRIAVREDSGFPPFAMASLRVLVASAVLLGVAAAARTRLRLSKQELAVLAASAVLLWVGGNGLVTWAEQRAHSGYAALLVGSMPIWIAVMEAALDRKVPSPRLVAALLVGFTGLGLLTAPVLAAGVAAEDAAVLALLAAPISWGIGSLLLKRRPLSVGTLATAGYQNAFGGVALLVAALATGEPIPNPTPEAWTAWAYLVVFGSILAFTAYVQVLRLLPMSVISTYAYVNPVGAVVLGRLVLNEPITPLTIAGAALVLLGVAGVFREQLRTPPPAVAAA